MVTDDPLLLRWGLQDLLDGLSTSIDRTSVQFHDQTFTEYVEPGESYTVRGYNPVENDEAIAHTLQEELSHAEGSERSQNWDDSWSTPITGSFPTPFLGLMSSVWWWWSKIPQQETLKSLFMCKPDTWGFEGVSHDYYSGQQDDEDEDFSTYDGEVGRRLHNMDSIPHVPRINGEIPTLDDASDAHQRLLDRLRMYDLTELKVDGDGNCQFRAFSDQLYRTPVHHKSIRDAVVNQLTSHAEYYEGYVPMKYSDYVKKMSRSGEWGDHVTLQAAADFYGVKICLLTSFKDTCFIEILPRQMKSKRVIFLSFWAEVHYNSVYPGGDLPDCMSGKKKGKAWHEKIKNKLKF